MWQGRMDQRVGIPQWRACHRPLSCTWPFHSNLR
jgi:hypothetical protein